MKVLIVSDIHGNFESMKKVIQNDSSFDKMLILGDILYGPRNSGYNPEQLALFLNLFKDKIIAVKGNCDYDTSALEFPVNSAYIMIPMDGMKVVMTHGHYYFKSHPPDVDFDVFLSGHSHVSSMERMGDKLYLNPGSTSNPRGASSKSYILYEDGEFQLKSVDSNKVLRKVKRVV